MNGTAYSVLSDVIFLSRSIYLPTLIYRKENFIFSVSKFLLFLLRHIQLIPLQRANSMIELGQ